MALECLRRQTRLFIRSTDPGRQTCNIMAKDADIADDVIRGSLKRSRSYHSDYGKKTYREIKDLAAGKPSDQKARQMKKPIEQSVRLQAKGKERRS